MLEVVGGLDSMLMEGPSDPDAQATIADFVDYTDYLPSDLVRSLTLIRGLDETYARAAQGVHELTKTYGEFPSLPADARPDLVTLRRQISEQLDKAINARESAYAEACRLYDVVDRHFDRLDSIKSKLHSLTTTINTAPEPESVVPGAESLDRQRSHRDRTQPDLGLTRITLRLDNSKQVSGSIPLTSRSRSTGTPRTRSRNPGSINPQSPCASPDPSENENGNIVPVSVKEEKSTTQASRNRSRKKNKGGEGLRLPGTATNAEINAVETSTSNALSLLKPPPEDAPLGGVHHPWLRLTEWELTRLRRKMKKNNVWQPSPVMIQRELVARGRGWDNYKIAKQAADAAGIELVDCDDIEYIYNGSEPKEDTSSSKPSNRGMKLNAAKKLRREVLAREAVQVADNASSSHLDNLSVPHVASDELTNANEPKGRDRKQASSRKRKPEELQSEKPKPEELKPEEPRPQEHKTEEGKTDECNPDEHQCQEPKREGRNTDGRKAERRSERCKPEEWKSGEQITEETTSLMDSPDRELPPKPKKLKLTNAAPQKPATTKTSTMTAVPVTTSPLPGHKNASSSTVYTEPRRSRRQSAVSKPRSLSPQGSRRTSSRPTSARDRRSSDQQQQQQQQPIRDLRRRKSDTPALKPGTSSAALANGPTVATTATATASPAAVVSPGATTVGNNTAASRRSRRPAPGPVTGGQDGGTAVSVGRRKEKPSVKKKRDGSGSGGSGGTALSPTVAMTMTEVTSTPVMALSLPSFPKAGEARSEEVVEEVDPNEPHYCICSDVSFGTMICCEDDNVRSLISLLAFAIFLPLTLSSFFFFSFLFL